MSFDWVTVSAQIVNFLILVWLLKRFLYGPVINAMEQREQHIAARLNEAGERERKADAEAEQHRSQREVLERRREEILAGAREEADGQRKQMLEAVRSEAAEVRESWLRQADQEKAEFLANLQRQSVGVIQAMTRQALLDLADAELEEQIVDSFIRRLKTLDEDHREALAKASGTITIASAFELNPSVRGRLTRAVHELLGHEAEVDYTRSASLICGIELTGSGRRLSWSLDDYMNTVAERIESAFKSVGERR